MDEKDQQSDRLKSAGQESSTDMETLNNTEPDFSVWWNEPADQDPENPMNWPSRRKWTTIGVLSGITFLTYVLQTTESPEEQN